MPGKKQTVVDIRDLRVGQTLTENERPSIEETPIKTIPTGEKYALSIQEAAQYFSIGIKKLRRLAEDNLGNYAVCNGNRFLIIRPKFEEYLARVTSI